MVESQRPVKIAAPRLRHCILHSCPMAGVSCYSITQGDQRGVYVGTLGPGESWRLLAEMSANAAYVAPVSGQEIGYVLFVREGTRDGPTRAPRDAAGGGRDVPYS